MTSVFQAIGNSETAREVLTEKHYIHDLFDLRFDSTIIWFTNKWQFYMTAIMFSIEPESVVMIQLSHHV